MRKRALPEGPGQMWFLTAEPARGWRHMSAKRGHRWYAATYDLISRGAERGLLGQLRPLVVGQAHGRVLEIGVGTGASFPYYQYAEILVATDPDPFMLRRAERRARDLACAVQLQQAEAEALPFVDGSFDAVVSALVLCTVANPDRALAEARRVLKTGGTFRFIEHVRADGWFGRAQDVVTPAWRWFGAGCHPNRRTVESIRAAGFDIVQLEQRTVARGPFVAGVATPTLEFGRADH
jgi:ubiquinone/menaquinone biosynthesis C-methylase UbiE